MQKVIQIQTGKTRIGYTAIIKFINKPERVEGGKWQNNLQTEKIL